MLHCISVKEKIVSSEKDYTDFGCILQVISNTGGITKSIQPKEEKGVKKILLHFTNFVDHYGIEIWEGDIIDCRYGRMIVRWDNQSSGFSPFIWEINAVFPYQCAVRGNIFDNEELLRQKPIWEDLKDIF